jgi:hypothetical protein
MKALFNTNVYITIGSLTGHNNHHLWLGRRKKRKKQIHIKFILFAEKFPLLAIGMMFHPTPVVSSIATHNLFSRKMLLHFQTDTIVVVDNFAGQFSYSLRSASDICFFSSLSALFKNYNNLTIMMGKNKSRKENLYKFIVGFEKEVFLGLQLDV